MDDPVQWTTMAARIGIPDNIPQAVQARGWTTAALFSYAFRNLDALDQVLLEILVTNEGLGAPLGIDANNWQHAPIAAQLRRLYQDSWRLAQEPTASVAGVTYPELL